MTSVVTGGAGFLGSHLVERLLNRGERVIVVDSFLIGSRQNLADLSQENLTVIEHDIRQPLSIDQPIDFVWNLACIASPIHYTRYPLETIEANTLGLPNMVALARAKGAKLLHTSTSEVYGDPLEHPQRETYWGNVNPNGEHACYKEAKRIGETLLTFSAKVFPELDMRMVRIFNTYGPKMALRDGRMLSEFIYQALHDRPIPVDGDGRQTRSTCYVSDLIEGLLAVMDRADQTRNEIINLGNPDEHTVQEFAELVIQTVGSGTISYGPARNDDVQRRCPDIRKAKRLLDWEPTVTLEDGLRETVAWIRKQLEK